MSFDQYIQRVMSGAERGPAAAALRAGLALAEPAYAAVVGARNRAYDRDPAKARRLSRPVVSVGNLTAGGTGKTPIVRWLAERLRADGRVVAVLSRGYKAAPGALGDEQRMLDGLLNAPAGQPPIVIRAHPDRFAAGQAVLRDHPAVDVFLLDDAFQHRRVARDLDVVLINAAEPFGHGHVLPRGLLREPMGGLRRAGAVVLTHARSVGDAERARIVDAVRRHNAGVPVYCCVHQPVGLRAAGADGGGADRPLADLRSRRAFAFCGIGNPAAFERELRSLAGEYVGHRWFPDHHAYTPGDLTAVERDARAAAADVLVTTEKDWVKLADLPGARAADLPVWRLDVAAHFLNGDGERLVAQVRETLAASTLAR